MGIFILCAIGSLYLGITSHLMGNLLWFAIDPETDPVAESRRKHFFFKAFVVIMWPLSALFGRGREILVDNLIIK